MVYLGVPLEILLKDEFFLEFLQIEVRWLREDEFFSLSYLLEFCPWVLVSSAADVKTKAWNNSYLAIFSDPRRFFSDPIGYTERLESPRVIKTHLPLSLLHPDVVKTSKVVVVMRNPKDCAASMFHHERLLPNHNMKHDFPFDQYAKIFASQAGTTSIYGDYWAWIKVL